MSSSLVRLLLRLESLSNPLLDRIAGNPSVLSDLK